MALQVEEVLKTKDEINIDSILSALEIVTLDKKKSDEEASLISIQGKLVKLFCI